MHNNSGITKYMSFTGTKDYDGPPKVGFEALASPGQVITVSTSEGLNSNHKPYSSNIWQTNTGCNKQGRAGYMVGAYIPKKVDANSIGRAHYKKTPPISNITSQNISVTRTDSAPVNTAFVGTTDLRSGSKPYEGPAQLTIFYAGSVCVYDEVSPEKAQAIMLLAGNGNSLAKTPNKTPTPTTAATATTIASRVLETQNQRPLYKSNSFNSSYYTTSVHPSEIANPIPISVSIPNHSSAGYGDGFFINEHRKSIPFSCNFPSPISVSSLSSGDVAAARSLASTSTTSININTNTPSAVPQARKASLARFMEKRKERAVITAPYPINGKQLQEIVNPKSESTSFPITTPRSFSFSSIK